MAKATILQVLNKILENLGEAQIVAGSLSALSGLSLLCFNSMNEVLYEIANDYKLQPLEADITLTMAANTGTYTNSVTLVDFDKDSFRYNSVKKLPYRTPQDFDRRHLNQTATGVPNDITLWKGFFRPYPIPGTSEVGRVISGRGWTLPTLYDTASTNMTSFIPEGFDLTLLANWVTFKVLSYKQNPEAQVYYVKVFGNDRIEGQLDKFKRLYGSPQILDGNIMVEPMEGGGYNNGLTQPPISG